MKREFIMTSRSLENKIKNQASRKIFLIQTAKKLIEQHVPVTDLDALDEGFRNVLYEGLKKRSQGALDSLGYEKIVGIYDMGDLDQRLRTMEIEYKKLSNIPLDKTYTKLGDYDCAVYAETPEEIKRLREYQTIEKSTEGLIKKGIPIHWGNYTKAFFPITAIDGQKLTPNINYIKHNRTH